MAKKKKSATKGPSSATSPDKAASTTLTDEEIIARGRAAAGQLSSSSNGGGAGKKTSRRSGSPGLDNDEQESSRRVIASPGQRTDSDVSNKNEPKDTDHDVLAKNRAKRSGGDGPALASPGAVSVSNNSNKNKQNGSGLSSTASTTLDQDVLAKNRARAPQQAAPATTTPGVVSVGGSNDKITTTTASSTSTLDRDVAAKNRARAPGLAAATSPGAVSVAAANTDNTQATPTTTTLDQDVIAKNRARAPRAAPATAPGIASVDGTNTANTSALDEDVAAKNRGRGTPATTPGAVTVASAAYATKEGGPALAPGVTYDSGSDNNLVSVKERDQEVVSALPRKDSTNSAGAVDAIAMTAGVIALGGSSNTNKSKDDTDAGMDDIGINPADDNDEDARVIAGKPSLSGDFDDPNKVDSAKFGEDDIIGDGHGGGADSGQPGGIPGGGVGSGDYYDEVENEEGLAVAVAINEEDDYDEGYTEEELRLLPSAIEYDPDAKPPLYKNRKVRFFGIFFIVAVILAVIAIVLGIVFSNRSSSNDSKNVELGTYAPTITPVPTPVPSFEPTDSEIGRIRSILEELFTPVTETEIQAFDDAFVWITEEDELNLTDESPNLEQRFLLAYFYYHITIEGPWASCGKANEAAGEDDTCDLRTFYRDEYDQIVDTFEPDNIRWLSANNECEYAGVFCDENDDVAAVDLFYQDFTGPLPAGLAALTTLVFLGLSFNDFTGTVPDDFAQLSRLINIELNGNNFEGPFPFGYYNARTLQRLNLGENALIGPIRFENTDAAKAIGNLQALKGFFIDLNQLTGGFPTEIGQLSFLAYTRVSENDFSDFPIPTEFGQLTLLQEMWLDKMNLLGTIPTELGLLTQMSDLRMSNNVLTGPIPEEIYNIDSFYELDVSTNYLTGTISTRIGELDKISIIRFGENSLSGTVPTEAGQLTDLLLFQVQKNDLTGSMPDAVCGLFSDPTSNPGGQLFILNADCLGDDPQIVCDCCTACCPADSGACFLQNN